MADKPSTREHIYQKSANTEECLAINMDSAMQLLTRLLCRSTASKTRRLEPVNQWTKAPLGVWCMRCWWGDCSRRDMY